MSNSRESQEKAAPHLEEGLVSLTEGLGHSALRCAQVLSVSCFFAQIERFPGSRGLFPEVKEAHFLLRDGGNC